MMTDGSMGPKRARERERDKVDAAVSMGEVAGDQRTTQYL